MLLRRLARPLLATAFIVDGIDSLRHPQPRVKSANELVQRGQRTLPERVAIRLPADTAPLVRANAAVQVGCGTLLALGKAPRLAAFVLAATVLPATATEQDFWAEADPERKAAKRTAFLKDLGLLGGLMIASADTTGKPSLGWRGRRAAHDAAAAITAALPLGAAADTTTGATLRRHAHDVAVRGADVAESAQSRGAELAEAAKEHGSEWAEAAKEHGSEWAQAAKAHGTEWAEIARRHGAEWAEAAKRRGPEAAEAAKERGAHWAEIAKQRGPRLADAAHEHSAHWVDIAKYRGPELAAAARERGAQLAEVARERTEARRR